MVSVVERYLVDAGDKLTSVESELVLLTLRRFDESIAPTLTPTSCETNLLLSAIKSHRHIATTDSSLASAAIAQVFHTCSVVNIIIWFSVTFGLKRQFKVN